MKKYCILFVATLCLTTNLHAKGPTNQDLVKACKDPSAGPQNFCFGFISAAINGAQFYRNMADVNDEYIDICFPKNILNKDIVADYIQWVEKNPAQLEGPAFIGVTVSFSTKYSCPQQQKSRTKKLNIE